MQSNRDILLAPRPPLHELSVSRLSSLLSEAPAVAAEMLGGTAEERPDAHIVIQNASAITASALRDHNAQLFAEGVSSLSGIWTVGDAQAMYPTRTPDFEASLWELLAVELYALGGLAIKGERWAEIRILAREKPDPASHATSWLRQGQVASARAATVPDETMLEIAVPRLLALDASLRRPDAQSALAQFDLVSCLMIREVDPEGFYPNAAKFSESVAEPIVYEQMREQDKPLREYLNQDDQEGLREGLRDYDDKARLQAAQARRANHDWQWRGFSDARTLLFIVAGQDWDGNWL